MHPLGLFALVLVAELALSWAAWAFVNADADAALAEQARRQAQVLRISLGQVRDFTAAVLLRCLERPEPRRLLGAWMDADAAEREQIRAKLNAELTTIAGLLGAGQVAEVRLFAADGEPAAGPAGSPPLPQSAAAVDSPLHRVLATGMPAEGLVIGDTTPAYHFVGALTEGEEVLGAVALRIGPGLLAELRANGTEASEQIVRLLLPAQASTSHDDAPPGARDADGLMLQPSTFAPTARTATQSADRVDRLEPILAADPGLATAIASGAPYRRRVCPTPLRCSLATLEPLPTIPADARAYLATYAADDGHPARLARALLILVIGSLLILASAAFLRQLLDARAKLRIICKHMAQGLYLTDRRGRVLFTNRAATTLLGLPETALLGSDARALFHQHPVDAPRDADRRCPILAATLAGEVYRNEEAVFCRRDGSRLPVGIIASPLHEQGQIRGSVVLFRDVSEEHQARIRLRQAETAFSNLAEGVLVTDAERNIRAVNAAFTAISGYREAEALGRNPRIFASGRHDAAFYRSLWAQVRSRGSWEGEIWNRRKNGEIYPQWLRITVVSDEHGQVVSYVGVCTDITEERAREARLRDLAYRDQLTGLFNRTGFMEVLTKAVARASKRAAGFALLYLDIDRFKRINETLGHALGDRMLLEVATRVRRTLRRHDDMARIGGDELAILLEDVDRAETVEGICESLLTVIREPMRLQNTDLHVSASIGVACYPADGDDPAALLKNADSAMYLVKRQGRDGYRLFTASLAADASRRFALEASLRRAISEGQLRLHYQPKLALTDGCLLGFEALIRWQHPELGLLGPGRFLDEAREAGMMQAINRWVLTTAARQCARWRANGMPVGRIACNLDAQVFRPQTLQATLMQIVRDAGITAEDLELEVIETVMRANAATLGLWNDLAAAGFDLAIDDFGTGESSLARLKQLPFSRLKIDRSFVRDIETDDNDRSIVRTIIAMTRALDKQAIAEGVETEAQLRFLIEAGCDAIQGYLISQPMPAEAVPDFIREDATRERIRRLREEIGRRFDDE